MKVRKSFVTNSSSSSFICVACDETYSGWDASPSDFGGFTCENDHQFCDCTERLQPTYEQKKDYLLGFLNKKKIHYETSDWYRDKPNYLEQTIKDLKILELNDKKDIEELYNEYLDEYQIPSIECPVCQLEIIEQETIARYIVKKTNISRDEVFNIIKEQNKKRKKLYNYEYIAYVCSNFGFNTEDIIQEIRNKYENYDKLIEAL